MTKRIPMTGPATTPFGSPTGRFARVLFALIMREMATRYGRSAGGYIWAILNPLGFVIVLSLVFSFVLRRPELGSSFALFFATGYVPFHIYNDLAQTVGTAARFNRPLINYPGVTVTDLVLSRFVLMVMTLMLVAILLFAGIILVENADVTLRADRILLAAALAALLGLAMGTLNCFLFAWRPTWENVWMIISRPLFLISGVFFTFESLPSQARDVLWYNPLVHITGLMREGFYGHYSASYAAPLYVVLVGITGLTVGLILLRRHRNLFLDT